ncbi:MAG: hypothetical protein E7022_03845 [Desulfovibrio desulfuricans]|nr:hypothetical protein [Desulfovibrio desulfuricans]
MSVCKHGKGWQVKIVRKGFPHQFKTFRTKFEAEAWEREILAEMDKGLFVSRTEAESTTLAELLQRFIDEYIPRLSSPARQITRIRALMRRPIASRIVATGRLEKSVRGAPR